MLAISGTVKFIVVALLAAAGPGPGAAAPDKNVTAEIARGQKLLDAGDLAGALQAFDGAAKLGPKDPRPVYLSGVALEKKNDLAGAEKAYLDAIARDASFAPAHTNLGALWLSKGDLASAERQIVLATLADPKNAHAAFNLGLLRDAQKQPREAAAAYRKSLQLNRNDGACHANLCSVLRRLGDLPGAIAECRQAVRLMPKSATALTVLGLLLADSKQLDAAGEQLRKATLVDPTSATAWASLGRVELRRKHAGPAADAFAKAAKLEPQDGNIAAEYCQALADKELRAPTTEERCRAAITLNPQSVTAHYELARALAARGDCAGVATEQAKLGAVANVSNQAKAQVADLVKTCVPSQAAKEAGKK
jgi:tetratricopeptide (TPR) repeat protein